MVITSEDAQANAKARIGVQPIAVAMAALIIVVGIAMIVLWSGHTGSSPEHERTVSARLLQARFAQASEQLVEKTKALEVSQQESIDQLQVVQDQLLVVKRLLTAQQTDTKRLSEQVEGLTHAVDMLRQSFASTPEASPPSTQEKSIRSRPRGKGGLAGHRKRAKSRS